MDEEITLKLTQDQIIYLYDALANTHATDINASVWKSMFSTVQGRMMSQVPFLRDMYYGVEDNKYCKEGISKSLFMGAGWLSINSRNLLHKRLSYAAMILGGKEQNGGQGTEFDEQSDKEDEYKIKEVLRDIIAAFGYSPEDLQTKEKQ